jgi:hypothetical protein
VREYYERRRAIYRATPAAIHGAHTLPASALLRMVDNNAKGLSSPALFHFNSNFLSVVGFEGRPYNRSS